MKILITFRAIAILAAIQMVRAYAAAAESEPQVRFVRHEDSLDILIGGEHIATYCFHDSTISRPYFAHVKTRSGIEVTRQHPPIAGKDLTDHATFHPGIWLAFGDLNGADYWRLKARVRHAGFEEEPTGGAGNGSFAVRNEYLDPSDSINVICKETARYTVHKLPNGYLLLWDSRFSSDHDFYFGDQEEMGVGFRVATPLRVDSASVGNVPPGIGAILDAEGRKNEHEIWGNAAKWCDYSGTLAGKNAGMAIICHPGNTRPSWFHARDYGLLVANLFGRKSFGKGEMSRIVVHAGDEFRLRYGVFVHNELSDSHANLDAAYQQYLQLSGS